MASQKRKKSDPIRAAIKQLLLAADGVLFSCRKLEKARDHLDRVAEQFKAKSEQSGGQE